MPMSMAARDSDRSDAEILGLDPHENDPVRIILAAQLRLRCCRLERAGKTSARGAEVRRIIVARDALLKRAVGRLGTGSRLRHPPAEAEPRSVSDGGRT